LEVVSTDFFVGGGHLGIRSNTKGVSGVGFVAEIHEENNKYTQMIFPYEPNLCASVTANMGRPMRDSVFVGVMADQFVSPSTPKSHVVIRVSRFRLLGGRRQP